MKNIKWKETGLDILTDITASILIAVGVYNFALNANFPVAGFSGVAIIMYHLFGIPVGVGTIIFNEILKDNDNILCFYGLYCAPASGL